MRFLISKKIFISIMSCLSVFGLLLSFQNCTNATRFSLNEVTNSSLAVETNPCDANPNHPGCVNAPTAVDNHCAFNGRIVRHGTSINAFQNSTVPHGQTCKVEARHCENGALNGSYSYASCRVGVPASCLFNGQTIAHGSEVTAYLSSTVAYGATCNTQKRRCDNGELSGHYVYGTCAVDVPKACLFNNITVPHEGKIKGYQSDQVEYGYECVSQDRKCMNGALDGNYTNASCVVGLPKSCQFDGRTVAHGEEVMAYLTSTVSFGATCKSEKRKCTNGRLSGAHQYGSCVADVPKACLFDGKTVPHNAVVKAYQNSTVTYGQLCVAEDRKCTNGILGGSYQYGSCVPGAPASCQFDGRTITHGDQVVAYQNSTVAYGDSCVSQVRSCDNGELSGNYTKSSCAVGVPATCTFNNQTVAHGQSIPAYANSSVPYGEKCMAEQRVCNNGALSGHNRYATCAPGAPVSCLFNNQTIAHGQSVTAYEASTVPFGQSCTSEQRTCNNGDLSGRNVHPSCGVAQPASCPFDGRALAHGEKVTAFESSNVPFGRTCKPQERTCSNGILSGQYPHSGCSVNQPATCQFDNRTLAHGQKVLAYQTSSVAFGQTCVSQERTCVNGDLSGDYQNASCVQASPATCPFNGQQIGHQQTVRAYAQSVVPYGEQCVSQSRTCNNGDLSGSFNSPACSVAPPLSCKFNGRDIPHGGQVKVYPSSQVAFAKTCESQIRTCINGKMDGYDSVIENCTIAPPAHCNFNGRTITHGSEVSVFPSAVVAFGQQCQSQQRSCYNGEMRGLDSTIETCAPAAPATCDVDGHVVGHNETVLFYSSRTVPYGQQCVPEARTCSNGKIPGTNTIKECRVEDPPVPICNIHYQFRTDKKVGYEAMNGGTSFIKSGENSNCDDGLCGFRMGIACTAGAQVKLKYQFKFFSTDSTEQQTDWSGLDGIVRWGPYSGLHIRNHPGDECQIPRLCGMRVVAETLNGRQCSVRYQLHIERNVLGNWGENGAWSLLNTPSGANETCDDSGGCGIKATLECGGGNIPVTPPNWDVNLVNGYIEIPYPEP